MYKIVILGCENSHANNFLRLIAEGKYPEIEVIGIYSNEPEAVKKLNEQFGTPIMADFADAVGQVDGVMITARHGDNHYKYAKPYMDAGIPMFIDKPITCSEEEAVAFMREARDRGIRLCGGSTCAALAETLTLAEVVRTEALGKVRGGAVVSPFQPNSPYGGFTFYAQHLIEIMTTIFGEGVQDVLAARREGALTFTARYENFSVQATYLEGVGYYSASVYGAKAVQNEILKFTPESFTHEMNDMLDLLHGEPMKKSYESFIYPVFVMNALMRAKDGWEPIHPIVL
ncbi:MAG: Gfo/Idh/MocA family oxidoreductase [Clostridia bacterium]|nr:Gfo/Idh/MocA family oxidoreductase [Clostridia bacterium]